MKFVKISSLIICIFFVVIGCSKPERTNLNKKTEPTTPKALTIDEMIAQMTLEEKIGQLMIIGVDGKSFTPEMKNLIQNYHVGGIVVMGKNVSTVNEMQQLINDSKTANATNKIPLFFSVDEEGGHVSRLPAELKKLPSNGQIGNRNDEAFSYRVGTYLSEVLNEFGYNMNFAPVLDVNNNPNNPIIGDRSFGSDPKLVGKLGVSTMRGMMDGGMISVVKHFPGHGDTSIDSHKLLPKVDVSLERLHEVELVPFQEAIDQGVDVVMVAHILFPALDPEFPSSMSKPIITNLLREEMKFDGVVITDDLTMGAIVNEYTVAEAAVQSFKAGSDILLGVHGYDYEINAIDAMIQAVESGTVTEERVNESVKRILQLKEKYKITDELSEAIDVQKINRLYNELMAS